MTETATTLILAGITGLFSGAAGSLIAPWIHWGIEKKRIKHSRRAELIKRWRVTIASQSFDRISFIESPVYGTLKEFLPESVRTSIQRPPNDHVVCAEVQEMIDG